MTDIFQMPFSGLSLNRLEEARSLHALDSFIVAPTAQAMILHQGRPALHPDMRLVFIHPANIKPMGLEIYETLFLGLAGADPIFAFSIKTPNDVLLEDMFGELRGVGGRMHPDELAMAGYARSLFDWHHTHQFCAHCGQASELDDGGLKRVCGQCGTEHFPRVNPVAIMLILKDDQCLMGRGAAWPEGFYSALAGFVSPGESLEDCCIREVKEEVGLTVRNPKYIFSQPWPYPGQLMMGLTCEAEHDDFTVNKAELETARWFAKDEIIAILNQQSELFFAPPKTTIAHQLLWHWAFS